MPDVSLAGKSASELRNAVVLLMENLPVLPVCIATLDRPKVDDDDHIEQILALAKIEPCLAIRMFAMAAKLMPSRAILSTRQAMALTGSRALDELLDSQLRGNLFQPSNAEEKCMWAHFLMVSMISANLAKHFRVLDVDPELAQEAGLLHDLGRLVHYEHLAKSPSEIESVGYRSPKELIQAEEAVFGISHVRLGTIAADVMHAPAFVRACIDHHHSKPESIPKKTADAHGKLIELVTIADEMAMFCHRWPVDDEDEFKRRAHRFLDKRSIYLKPLKPNLDEVYKLLLKSHQETQQTFPKLALGEMPQLEKMAA